MMLVKNKSNFEKMFPSEKFQEILDASFVCTFGYDDHSRYIYEHAFPVHQAHDAPGTFFITTGRIEEQDRSFGLSEPSSWGPVCTWEELREMHTAQVGAISVENHTHSHPNLANATEERLFEEFQTSQEIFKRRGFNPKYTSYPYGAHNDLTKLYASAFFKAGRGVEGIAKNDGETDRFNIHSYNLDTAPFSFVEQIIQAGVRDKLWIDFYAHAVHPDGETDMGAQVPTPQFLSDVMQAVKDAGGIILSLDDAVNLFMKNFYWTDKEVFQSKL